MEDPLKAKPVMEKTNLDGTRELPQTNSCVTNTGEKRKREGMVIREGEKTGNNSEYEQVILVGDTKAVNDFGFDGGEQNQRSVNVQSDGNRKGSLQKEETGEEPGRAKQYSNFNDFDKLREESSFAVGQIWALYDADGMPRLYAQIREISAPGFGLGVTWLEPHPDDEKEIKKRDKELPVSRGKFRLGKNEKIRDRRRFSHVVHCNEGSNAGTFSIYPRKRETWIVFKGRYKPGSFWDIDWSADPESRSKYQYVFVEILSDEVVGVGLCVPVRFLHKVKGFSSVFCRFTVESETSYFSRDGKYQFSHCVPSFKATGFEAKGVPRGAYELDPVALPKNIKEIDVPLHLLAEPAVSNTESNTHSERVYVACEGKTFETGQIWSFYGSDYSLPRYYGRIQKIAFTQAFEQDPVVKLYVARLRATPIEGVIEWIDRKMPIGCGNFRANKIVEIYDLDVFLRQISVESSGDGNDYSIMPKAGDFWVIYRRWSSSDEVDDLQYQSYDLVEVLDDKLDYEVLVLEPDRRLKYAETAGCGSVYVAATEQWTSWADIPDVRFTIPKSQLLRFSHQVPTLRVTKEIDGVLEQVYEPDIKLLPYNVRASP